MNAILLYVAYVVQGHVSATILACAVVYGLFYNVCVVFLGHPER